MSAPLILISGFGVMVWTLRCQRSGKPLGRKLCQLWIFKYLRSWMSRPSVLVIDAGLGNIGSVMAALQRHDCSAQRLQRLPTPEGHLCL